MHRICFPLAASVCLLVSCGTPVERLEASLGNSPVVEGGTYSSGGGLTVAADIREDRNLTLACGAYAVSRRQSVLTLNEEYRVLGTGTVFLGDQPLVTGLTFMNKVMPSDDYAGAEARCLLLNRPWMPEDNELKVKIRIPAQVVLQLSGGNQSLDWPHRIYFSPTGPGAGEW